MSEPTTHQQLPVLQFDPLAPGLDADPYPTYERMREQAPILYWPQAPAYVVARYQEVVQVLRDTRLTTDAAAAGKTGMDDALPAELRGVFGHSLYRLTPKDHARVRAVVNPAFGPRAVERLRPQIQQLIDEAFAPFEGKEEIDIVPCIKSIPLRVIARMLGVPFENEADFRRAGEAIFHATDARISREQRATILAPLVPGIHLLRSLIAERRQNPGDDLLSTLIRAEATGNRLSEDEMLGLIVTILAAGSETVDFLYFTVKSLLCVPERAAEVLANPAALRGALEEILRIDYFGKSAMWRYATEDLEIGGVRIEKGARILAFIPAALSDPRAFTDADRYNAQREEDRSLAFGAGMHFCLGTSLALFEGEVLVQTLLERYADMRLLAEPVYAPHPVHRKLTSLRVGVTPRTRGVDGAGTNTP